MSSGADTGRPASSGDPISRFLNTFIAYVIRIVPALAPLRGIAETIARFVSVGAASSVLYAAVVVFAVSVVGWHHDIAAVLGFAIAAPFNFLMHRYFTFRSLGLMQGDMARYAMMQTVNVALSIGAMAVSVDGFHLPYAVGILGAIVIVPIVTYFVMDRWVFRDKAI